MRVEGSNSEVTEGEKGESADSDGANLSVVNSRGRKSNFWVTVSPFLKQLLDLHRRCLRD